MNNINNVHNCVGCLSCVDRCPKHCIHIATDSLGHVHTHADEIQCIDCGLCIKSCPAMQESAYRKPDKAYALWRTDDTLRRQSSSGGIGCGVVRTDDSRRWYCLWMRFRKTVFSKACPLLICK